MIKKYIMLILLAVLVSACAKTVKIDHEGETKSGMLEEVPKWFVEKEGNNVAKANCKKGK